MENTLDCIDISLLPSAVCWTWHTCDGSESIKFCSAQCMRLCIKDLGTRFCVQYMFSGCIASINTYRLNIHSSQIYYVQMILTDNNQEDIVPRCSFTSYSDFEILLSF